MVLEVLLRHFKESSFNVRSQSFGWLVCHLHGVLQNRHREILRRHRTQEDSELSVNFFRIFGDCNYFPLHGQHPRRSQVTILQF